MDAMTDSDSKPETTETPEPATDAVKAKNGAKSNAVWMGTAVGVGSAALVAALMYAKRRK
jgi:tetrahydromethanopterin S-methyltransferase subunit B